MKFTSDNDYYQLLIEACESVAKNKVPGLYLEIGTRGGGSAELIANTLKEHHVTGATIVCVDPYGDILYEERENKPMRLDYTNGLRDQTIPELHKHVTSLGYNFVFLNLEDTEFFKRYSDGIPLYSSTKRIANEYALVFIDGPHSLKAVLEETQFFMPKISDNGVIVYDDCVEHYDHSVVEQLLFDNGFVLLNSYVTKKSYIKAKEYDKLNKIIGFVTEGLEFNGNSMNEKALGGSESALIYMARELAKHDNMVFVYCLCDKPGIYDGVIYLPIEDFNTVRTNRFDVLIVSRSVHLVPPEHVASLVIYWMHDLWVEMFPKAVHLCDKVFLLSEYQKSIMLQHNKHYDPLIHVTSNGFDSDLAAATPILSFNEKKNNYIYASRPERGLKWLLKFIWPQVLKKNPEAQLSVCRYDHQCKVPEETELLYAEIEELMASSTNVTMLGYLTKPEYFKKLGESAYMLYPCNFPEISCINAIEAQAMECLVISSDAYALPETVKTATLAKIGDDYYPRLRELIYEYQDEQKYTAAVKSAREKVYGQYPWKQIASDWDNYINRMFEERYEQFKPQICRRLGHNSDYVTWSKIDPDFDPKLIPHIVKDNLNYDYYVSMWSGINDPNTPDKIDELKLNVRQSQMVTLVSEYLQSADKKLTILDIGCYDGPISGTIYKKNADKIEKVIGYDALQAALDAYKLIWGKNEQCKNMEFICDNITNLSSHNLKADVIIVGEVLEHFVDYKKVLEDIHRCANKGALVLFSTPVGPFESICMKERNDIFYGDHHLHHFEMSDIMQIFDGFDVDNNFFMMPAPVAMLSYRGEHCSNYIYGYYNNVDIPFHEYDPILKAKKTRPYFSISTCMIVKNEENNLFRCLNSIKHISDEIIIVDTGSTDFSKEICKRFTNKIYDLNWEEEDGIGNFERARNYSISKATGDWIFWLDADEALINPSDLANYTRTSAVPTFGLLQKQIMAEGNTGNDQYPDRLFRRGAFQFFGIIHEQPRLDPIKENDNLELLIPEECRLEHLGYVNDWTRMSKVLRNHDLLLKNIRKYPELIDNYIYMIRDMVSFYQYYADEKYLDEAVATWKKYPKQYYTSKEMGLWFMAFNLMQKIYVELKDKNKMTFIEKENPSGTLLFASEDEFTLFQEVVELNKLKKGAAVKI